MYHRGEVEQEIDSFMRLVPEIKKQYQEILRNSESDEKEEVVSSSSSYSSKPYFHAGDTSQLVGLRDELDKLKQKILFSVNPWERRLRIFSIVGMAGIGKTALAKAFCEDLDVWLWFDYLLFVPVGPKYQPRQVLLCILSQLNHGRYGYDDRRTDHNHEEELSDCVTKVLKDKRYIIVLDDVWEEVVWIELQKILPDDSNRSCVMVTTRLHVIRSLSFHLDFCRLEKQFLDKEQSWDLLCKKVFGADPCPYELKKFGKKIAEKCEGLPLAIISVGKHLANPENKMIEYWEYVAEKGIASIVGADDELMKVLHLSYVHLNVDLKAHFLYLGVFPQTYEIYASKLVDLWIAEGFLEYDLHRDCLMLIARRSLVVAKQERFPNRIKSCQLHIVYWQYCKTQAPKEKLFQVLHTLDDCLLEVIKSQRRLCIHNNTLFGIKDASRSMASVLNVRSLLCTGPYHNYPVTICLGLKLLRILHAISIRFYEFPSEMLKLVLLRYIALTYDGNLPSSIHQLINLWYLIVHRHNRIIYPRRPSYLPSEIWNMKELKHLQVTGSEVPQPPRGASLPNLRKLLDVTPQSCTKQVLRRIPNLKKLGVQIVLPVDATEPLCSLDYLRNLNGLKSLKCIVVNPKPSSLVAAQAYPASIFSEGLKKLSLSGFGYSWNQMREISVLPNLESLKLRHCAFQGSRWFVREGEFLRLGFLLLEDLDIRYWDADPCSFRKLGQLIIRNCYNLEQIPIPEHFVFLMPILKSVEIVDCKPSVVASAERLRHHCEVSVLSSWDI